MYFHRCRLNSHLKNSQIVPELMEDFINSMGGQLYQDSFLALGFKNQALSICGFDKLDIICRLLGIIAAGIEGVETNFDKFKSYLAEKINRDITPEEEMSLLNGLLAFNESEPETQERKEATIYLFELQFLNI